MFRYLETYGCFFYELRLLTRQRQNITELRTIIKNQLDALSHAMRQLPSVTAQLKQNINLFEIQIKELDKVILQHLKSDEKVLEKVNNICTMKGLGILTTAVVLSETNGFTLFNNYKQVVSYAGDDVAEAQSGTREGKQKYQKVVILEFEEPFICSH
jgi:transposase